MCRVIAYDTIVYAIVEKKKVIEKNTDANVLRQRKRVDINVV